MGRTRIVPRAAATAVVLGLSAAAVPAVAPAGAAAAPRLTRCAGESGFGCGTLSVPLDHSGATPGTLRLRFAVQTARSQRRKPLLVALAGGPGQAAVRYASSFAASLAPLLDRYRLVVLDQRGTGRSGALRCPALQRLGDLAPVGPDRVAACAQSLGPARARYATRDSVEDLDVLRQALGAPKLALMGVSYGTFVAQQYARVHPDTTDRLILDSVVGADGVDPFGMDTYRVLPRVLREQCARGRCAGVTEDPLRDLAALVTRLGQQPLEGRIYDDYGRRRTARYASGAELANAIVAGDLNPFLQAALPGALAAAVAGDASELLRLRAVASGPRTPTTELSAGLFVTTSCADAALPYALGSPLEGRPAAVAAALDAIDPATYAPFDRATVLATSTAQDCSRWPQDAPAEPSDDPLPDVPALILTGRLDLRTPMESAVAVASELPRAEVVRVPGDGHDQVDSDITGCVVTALRRFAAGRRVGAPCRGRTDQVPVLPRPPRSLREFRRAPGVPGDRGRLLFAALDTASDVRVTYLQRIFAGLRPSAGGLHGGDVRVHGATLRLRRYGYVPGVRLSGTLTLHDDGEVSGRVRVDGPGRLDGVLRLRRDGGARGELGGRGVRYAPSGRGRAARAGRSAAPPLTAAVRALPDAPPRRSYPAR